MQHILGDSGSSIGFYPKDQTKTIVNSKQQMVVEPLETRTEREHLITIPLYKH